MTINIALVTNDAVVLGCDSVASVVSWMLDPFSADWERLKDGRARVHFEPGDLRPIVTETWGGVTKMFALHDPPSPVAAVTAGLAKLNGRTMESLAEEYRTKTASRKRRMVDVEVIAKDFMRVMRKEFDRHYEGSAVPPEYREGPDFLVGGWGRDDSQPSLYRIRVKDQEIRRQLMPAGVGVAWNGQADAIHRLMFGYDAPLRLEIERAVHEALEGRLRAVLEALVNRLQELLPPAGVQLPEGFEVELPEGPVVELPWSEARLDCDFGNLPLQYAIDFTAFLAMMQSGKARFARGVPTVGGRIHIGYITRGKSLRLLNEPELTHRNVGFVDGV